MKDNEISEYVAKNICIRKANPEDAKGIVNVHFESWKSTYRGIFPDNWLDKSEDQVFESIEKRKNQILSEQHTLWPNFVAEFDGKIVGWVAGSINDQKDFNLDCDLSAIYILEDYQGLGIGTMLVKIFAKFIISRGYSSFILWVLKENYKARSFYEKLGGDLVGESKYKSTYPVVAYGWKNLSLFVN
ncbi:MAG: GNAT family N-acetyltransferase [Candidatus Delongbacteria bacterium]|nr:GNAT family N-acetyltransferase [Candidatus Delongbacteria bacterium]MBN2835862.1 GNAT family N-acetyltransferase [Candidatus Delongbacteria bacterium]